MKRRYVRSVGGHCISGRSEGVSALAPAGGASAAAPEGGALEGPSALTPTSWWWALVTL
jgi:hypothetical protein